MQKRVSNKLDNKLLTALSNNRRGQEGLTLTTLLLIVLGIVVVVVLIIGFTQGFDFIFGKVKVLPGQDLQAVVSSCEIAGQSGLKADYCQQFKEIELDGKKEFVNCEDSRVVAAMNADKVLDGGCPNISNKTSVVIYCEGVEVGDRVETTVNGNTCDKHLA